MVLKRTSTVVTLHEPSSQSFRPEPGRPPSGNSIGFPYLAAFWTFRLPGAVFLLIALALLVFEKNGLAIFVKVFITAAIAKFVVPEYMLMAFPVSLTDFVKIFITSFLNCQYCCKNKYRVYVIGCQLEELYQTR